MYIHYCKYIILTVSKKSETNTIYFSSCVYILDFYLLIYLYLSTCIYGIFASEIKHWFYSNILLAKCLLSKMS